MSCIISRRNFMRGAGVGALVLATGSLLGGCTKFDAEYGLGQKASWTDSEGGTLTMLMTEAWEVTANQHADFAENYQLKVNKTQRYIYFRMEVNNNTAQPIELYRRRFGIDWFDPEYNDEQVRKAFYTWEKGNGEDGTLPTYPNANKVVQVPTTLWAYNNGTNLNSSSFGIVCYTGTAGQPRQENTYGSIPAGLSYLDCIGQITENMQTFRLVYRTAGKEVNFVLRPSDLG